MSGEDQERFEDYLELEHYIEELQAGHVAHPPAELTPSQASIYRMAALFRSSLPEANEPRPEFAADLQARLERELQQKQQPQQPQQPQHSRQTTPAPQAKKRFGLSRRAMLSGGAAIAASLVVGVAGGAMIEHAVEAGNDSTGPQGPTANNWQTPLVPPDIPTVWHQVTTLAALGNNAVPFIAGAVVGYVIRDKAGDAATDNNNIIAMSAACTHMGCIVQWQNSDRKFHCPCHGGLFTANGGVDTGASPVHYLTDLPRLQTRIENGNVYVQVPATQR